MKRVQVDWLDITGASEELDVWSDRETILEKCKIAVCSTTGWLIERTKYRLVIASSRTNETPPHYSDINIIPRGCVKRITDLPDLPPVSP